jgi:hypothetical protein
LEEGRFAGFHTGVSGRNEDIGGSDGASSGWRSDFFGENDIAGLVEVPVGEDETDVACFV